MQDLLTEALKDAIIDTAKLLPFLFVTYLVMEFIESRTEEHSARQLSKSGALGPVIGGLVGVIPQCGFSASAASLYAGGVISLGTIMAVFLSTSDEMLPILISEAVAPLTIIKILGTKILMGCLTGLIIDGILRMTRYEPRTQKHIHDLCEQDHCGCEEEGGIWRSALIHTGKVALFIFLISLAINLVMNIVGREAIGDFLHQQAILSILLAGLIGLIPNCAASVMITELYLSGLLASGAMMAGLLVSAGVGILVLIQANRHPKENLKVIAFLYATGILWGLLIQGFQITF